MSLRTSCLNDTGFTLAGMLMGLAIAAIVSLAAMTYVMANVTALNRARIVLSQDRVVMGVRTLAGTAAALRNSMRATGPDGRTPLNPNLLACAAGNPANACTGFTEFPMTLFSPVVVNSGGAALIQSITSPMGSPAVSRLDVNGMPCTDPGPSCPLLVYTSFIAQCGPLSVTSAAALNVGTLSLSQLAPQATCTVADTITVKYQVLVDPALVATVPGLAGLSVPGVGTVTTPVVAISGNVPQ